MPEQAWDFATKALLYAAVLVGVGACAIRSLLLPLVADAPPTEHAAVVRTIAPVRTWAAAVVLVALALRALNQTFAVFGWPFAWSDVEAAAIDSRWGAAWRLQVLAALVFFGASLWAGRRRARPDVRGGVVLLASIALSYAMPLVGHGATSGARMLLHGTHVIGAGIWTGTLMALLSVKGPMDRRLALLRALSPLALSGALLVVIAGTSMAYTYLGSLSNLWHTTYGQLLIGKLLLFFGVIACGGLNWKRFAAERRGKALVEHQHIVRAEVAFIALLVVVTAMLTETGHP